jgi:hypothetical protein
MELPMETDIQSAFVQATSTGPVDLDSAVRLLTRAFEVVAENGVRRVTFDAMALTGVLSVELFRTVQEASE